MRSKFPSAIWAIPAIALVLLWPALLNGYPFLFADTDPYIRQGQQVLPALGGLLKGQTAHIDYLQSRSGVFGAFLYSGYRIADFWSVAILQALVMAWLVWTTVRVFDLGGRIIAIIVGVLALSTAPFEAVFMMPDAWTGLLILVGLLLLLASDRLGFLQRIVCGVVFLFCILIHQTHLILALLLVVLGVGLLVLTGVRLRKALLTAAPLAALALGGFAINAGIQATLGSQLTTTPFLSARMLADGPGRKHLDAACAANADAYELCKYSGNPLTDTLDTLFSPNPAKGAFAVADREGQIRMNEEQSRFVLNSVMADPIGAVASMFANGARQLVKFTLWEDFGSPTGWTTESSPDWGDKARGQILSARLYDGSFPLGFVSFVIYATAIVSLAFLAWRFSRRDIIRIVRDRTDTSALLVIGMTAIVLVVIVANAFLCGSLSGAYERFQTRVIWLLPLAAMIVLARFGAAARTTNASPTASGT